MNTVSGFPLRNLFVLTLLLLGFSAQGQTTTTNQLPKFEEVYKLLQDNFGAMNREELDRALVRGLLAELKPQVLVVATNDTAATATSGTNQLSKAMVYDNAFAYFRVNEVEGNLAEELAKNYRQFTSTNKIKGVVLDLRFANGEEYAVAAKTADKFLNSQQPLVNWGGETASSVTKTNAIGVPVAVLINKETQGAAEALAAALRETKVGLLIGSKTAGQASIFKDFPLQNGQRLRIATAPIKVGHGQTVLTGGLKPDIEVSTSAEDEKAYFEDAYRSLVKPVATLGGTNTQASAASTNQARSRMNEAELVRRHREGLSIDEIVEETTGSGEELRLVRDPALARALDLLKGLAVVGQTRPM